MNDQIYHWEISESLIVYQSCIASKYGADLPLLSIECFGDTSESIRGAMPVVYLSS